VELVSLIRLYAPHPDEVASYGEEAEADGAGAQAGSRSGSWRPALRGWIRGEENRAERQGREARSQARWPQPEEGRTAACEIVSSESGLLCLSDLRWGGRSGTREGL